MPGGIQRLLSATATVVVLAAGCGGGSDVPATVPVSGKVTYKGQPVPMGTITFVAADGRAAVGALQPDGTYRLTSFKPDDGAVVGHHRVTVVASDGPPGMPGMTGYKPPKDLVPKAYALPETSGLDADVSADRTTFDFDLK